MFNKFPSIDNFHTVRRNLTAYEEYTPKMDITYRGKIKLHGTNAGVNIQPDGRVLAQSRNNFISVGNDNAGFAGWLENKKDFFAKLESDTVVTVFGEWAGKGIMKNAAVCSIPEKNFFIFAIQYGTTDGEDTTVVIDPDAIKEIVGVLPDDIHIIPWEGESVTLNFTDKASLEAAVEVLNKKVEEVEACDPYIKELFDTDGVGEGLVFYPISLIEDNVVNRDKWSRYSFKAKGDKHKGQKDRKAVSLDPEVVATAEAFAEKFVTEARCEQMVRELNKTELVFNNKQIGPFLGMLGKDVKKESVPEVEASGIDWKVLNKACMEKARKWYMGNLTTI